MKAVEIPEEEEVEELTEKDSLELYFDGPSDLELAKLEIINRIELLYNFFNKLFFKKFNIKMILKSTIYNDDFDNIMTYHNYIIEKIIKSQNKNIEENNIPIDYITGTSMGALIGGLYASGYSPQEIETLFTSEKFQKMYKI